MSTLLLKKNAILEFTRSYRSADSASVEDATMDVSKNAVEYLGEPLTLAADVKLVDLLMLIKNNPTMQPVFARVRVAETLATLNKYTEDLAIETDFDYLEFYQVWEKDSELGELTSGTRPSFHAVGKEQTDGGTVAPYRQHWGFGGGEIYSYLNVPVRINAVVELVETGVGEGPATLDSFKVDTPTLFEVLYSMLWNLTYFGAPKL